METQFVTNDEGKKVAVIIDIDEYYRIHERLDELEDMLLYDEAKPEVDKAMREGNWKTLEELKKELRG